MRNILTVDVEDWYELSGQQLRGAGQGQREIMARQLDRVLDLLARHACHATFFCLGRSLADCPHLVTRIADAGHEVASHGWGHEPIFRIGLERFRDDLRRCLDWLGSLTGRRVLGYRAPAFSVSAEQLEGFYDVCFDCGLAYDSSVFPIRGRRYGIPTARREPHVVRQDGGRSLVELPLATAVAAGRRWPIAGGGYWRLMPRRVIRAGVDRLNAEGLPAVTYLHPYEFDAQRLSATRAAGWSFQSLAHGLRQNVGRRTIHRKLDWLLSRVAFGSAQEYMRDAGYL